MTDTCRHCGRSIVNEDGSWVDPNATGDDVMWRETCDSHDTFLADHEPQRHETDRKFYRTVYTVEVLSENGPAADMNLETLAFAISEGDCSGTMTDDGGVEVTRQEMARRLIAQASDPEFFRLTETGADLDGQEEDL